MELYEGVDECEMEEEMKVRNAEVGKSGGGRASEQNCESKGVCNGEPLLELKTQWQSHETKPDFACSRELGRARPGAREGALGRVC